MSDLLVPVVAGVVMAIVALIAHHLWMQRDALPPRPDARANGGVGRAPSVPVPEDAGRTFPAPAGEGRRLPAYGETRRTSPESPAAAAPAVPSTTIPPPSGRLRPVMSTTGKVVPAQRTGADPLRRSSTADLPVAGAAIRPGAPDRGGKQGRIDGTLPAPVRRVPTTPQPRRGRSTIQLDPLDAPMDLHNARIAVGGLIDDLETGRLGHGR